ncbi:MAG: hypothetical protein C5B47_01405 [Verrucomicrobia bacterium]|nr:MAG: hypothetical protein C5B47_01405 [Verrucomicrobiota bacterium]
MRPIVQLLREIRNVFAHVEIPLGAPSVGEYTSGSFWNTVMRSIGCSRPREFRHWKWTSQSEDIGCKYDIYGKSYDGINWEYDVTAQSPIQLDNIKATIVSDSGIIIEMPFRPHENLNVIHAVDFGKCFIKKCDTKTWEACSLALRTRFYNNG